MRYGATVAAAKAGSSPEFLVQRREPGAGKDTMAHAIFHVSSRRDRSRRESRGGFD